MTSQTLFSPAKLNLFLAITGRRPDGFHDLVSVVAPLSFGDELRAERVSHQGAEYSLACSDAQVPTNDSNLVLRAARAFAAASGWRGSVAFRLEKRIPMGAGLGGGSSNAAAALRALNALAGHPLSHGRLVEIAAGLGSDCPLFLQEAPVIMRGRGECLAPLPPGGISRLRGRGVLVFKPQFGIPTAWAYGRMAELAVAGADGTVYLPADAAELRLQAWLKDAEAPAEALLFNNMERPAFEKYLALPALLEVLRVKHGLVARMTGSGSACFALLPDPLPVEAIEQTIRAAWGETAFIVAARLA